MTPYRLGEVAPSAGLAPCVGDLFAAFDGPTLEQAICHELGLPDIEIVGTGTVALVIALTYLRRQSPHRSKVVIPAYTCPLVVAAAAAVDGSSPRWHAGGVASRTNRSHSAGRRHGCGRLGLG